MTESDWLTATDPTPMLEFLGDRLSLRKRSLFGLACCRRVIHLVTDPRVLAAFRAMEKYLGGAADAALAAVAAGLGEATDDAWEERYNAESSANFGAHPAYAMAGAVESAVCAVTRVFDWVAPAGNPPWHGHFGSWAESDPHEHAAAAAGEAAWAYAQLAYQHRVPKGDGVDFHFHILRESIPERTRAAVAGEQAAILRDIAGNPFHPLVLNPALRTSSVFALCQTIYTSNQFDLLPVLGDALEEAGCQDATVLGHARGGGGHWRGCWLVDSLLGKC